jgi:hypothetical protein
MPPAVINYVITCGKKKIRDEDVTDTLGSLGLFNTTIITYVIHYLYLMLPYVWNEYTVSYAMNTTVYQNLSSKVILSIK